MAENLIPDPPPRISVRDAALQQQLMARREKLRETLPTQQNPEPLYQLLYEVDAALERMEAGTFGLCETCHEGIENERLIADPLCRNCLDHMSAAEKQALERDLDLAFQVQSGLLPKPGPIAHGWTMAYHYQPAGPVSGDYCDLIRLDDGSALFLLGDVMGKGVAASMLMAHLHAIFRSLGTPTRPVSELVATANRVFREGTLSSFFATLVCGRLGRDGEVDICNAGHCSPLLIHGGTVSRIESTGLPLGIFADAEYTSYHGKLIAGDGLVIHSDGLSEALNSAGDPYGGERPQDLLQQQRALPPDQLLAALLGDFDGFRIDVPLKDDLSVMVIGRQS
jgi:sigma-B regulation protein RsbU (phosphoserine phosphatase)